MRNDRNCHGAVAAATLGLVLAFGTPSAAGPAPRSRGLAEGRLLVASHDLADPNFARTVVLLLSYDAEGGAMGLVLNRPTEVKPSELLPKMDGLSRYPDALYFGGPVGLDVVTLLVRSASAPEESRPVVAGVHVSRSERLLRKLAKNARGRRSFRLYSGYAGWAPGQLENEVARGDWRIVPADPDVVFADEPSSIWYRLVPPAPHELTMVTRRRSAG